MKPNYETVYDVYITQNNNRSDTASILGVSTSFVSKLTKEYNIVKSSDLIRKCKEKTNLKRFGAIQPMASLEYKEKQKINNLKKYGVEYTFQRDDVKNKIRATNLNRYGCDNAAKSDVVKEKIKSTNMIKYGVENYGQTECMKLMSKERVQTKYVQKYGLKKFELMNDKENLEKFILDLGYKPSIKHLAYNLNCSFAHLYDKIEKFELQELILYKSSSIENFVANFLNELDVYYLRNDKSKIKPLELDFFIPSINLAIEINDTASHNVDDGFKGNASPKDKKYHLNKTMICLENDIRLIHIYDWEIYDTQIWEKVKNYLKSLIVGKSNKFYARKCSVKNIDNEILNKFLAKYHLQGRGKKPKYAYGLYYCDKLISVMTFGKPNFNNNYQYELLRYCTEPNSYVVGGAQKLFNYFIKKNNPNNIISYCDIGKFSGEVYEKLNFKEDGITEPTYVWVNKSNVLDRYNWKVILDKGVDNLLGTTHGKGTNNIKLMIEHGFVRVYNSGNRRYIWKIINNSGN